MHERSKKWTKGSEHVQTTKVSRLGKRMIQVSWLLRCCKEWLLWSESTQGREEGGGERRGEVQVQQSWDVWALVLDPTTPHGAPAAACWWKELRKCLSFRDRVRVRGRFWKKKNRLGKKKKKSCALASAFIFSFYQVSVWGGASQHSLLSPWQGISWGEGGGDWNAA